MSHLDVNRFQVKYKNEAFNVLLKCKNLGNIISSLNRGGAKLLDVSHRGGVHLNTSQMAEGGEFQILPTFSCCLSFLLLFGVFFAAMDNAASVVVCCRLSSSVVCLSF